MLEEHGDGEEVDPQLQEWLASMEWLAKDRSDKRREGPGAPATRRATRDAAARRPTAYSAFARPLRRPPWPAAA